ncbi:MAG: DUF1501 domain-containing protein, partial [Planctomycetota bacterium]
MIELRNNGPEAAAILEGARRSVHRSIYLPQLRTLTPQSLQAFDPVEQGMTTGAREFTTVPAQALYLLNSEFEQRGLLDDTLVLFGSEFGRMPTAQGVDGRDHNITGYPMWLAGAGVRPGFSWGATDDVGLKAVEGRMHTTDLHATLLA